MPDDREVHAEVPEKVCAQCGHGPVTIGTVTTSATYYLCTPCGHVWAEPYPPRTIPQH